MSTASLHAKTYLVVTLMVLSSTTGNLLLSRGMKDIGAVDTSSVGQIVRSLIQTLSSSAVWLGIASLLLFFVFYLLVLSWADYSWVLPASASGYALVPLLGYALLGETVTTPRWIGVGLICAGVALVSCTPPSTKYLDSQIR